MTHRRLDEQVIVVFGATSGIGRLVAERAAAAGASVVAAGRDPEALDSLLHELGGTALVGTAEAADPDQVEAIARLAVDTLGRIDTWAHVAGEAEHARFEDMTADSFRRVVDVDLLGPVWGTRAALPHLRASSGALVVVSSQIAERGISLVSSYSAAKHGVDGFLDALRAELRRDDAGVTVTQVLPAAIGTPFLEHARTRLGVRPSGPRPVYRPEKVADAILHAAEHGGRDLTLWGAAQLQIALQRLSPRLMDGVARKVALRFRRSDQPIR